MDADVTVGVVDYQAPDAPAEFTRSLHETGFAVLINHPLPQALVQQVYDEWLAFFQTDAKNQYHFDPEKMDGYFSPKISETAKGYTKRDLKEFYHIYPTGRYPSEVSDAALKYYEAGNTLATELLQWVEDHTPADIKAQYSMPLSDMITDSELAGEQRSDVPLRRRIFLRASIPGDALAYAPVQKRSRVLKCWRSRCGCAADRSDH